MKIGVVFPHNEIGADPEAVKAFAQAAEGLGFDHLLSYDHVVGASSAVYDKRALPGPYREMHLFHEPLVLFGYLAGVTSSIELVTSILILPQRQTTLVAKQAAEVDVLSGGRLRLGVGTGWNPVEYTALGASFEERGARLDEQVELLRKLWTEEIVDFKGKFHEVPSAGLNPLPVQRPIPIWFGGVHERVLRRVAESGDGWMPLFPTLESGTPRGSGSEEDPAQIIARMRGYAEAAGRDPNEIGIECRLSCFRRTDEDLREYAQIFKDAGVTHLTLVATNMGYEKPEEHIDGLVKMREAVQDIVQ